MLFIPPSMTTINHKSFFLSHALVRCGKRPLVCSHYSKTCMFEWYMAWLAIMIEKMYERKKICVTVRLKFVLKLCFLHRFNM